MNFMQAQGSDAANDPVYNPPLGWNTGDNGGTGFGPWLINIPGSPATTGGVLIDNSNISTADASWTLWSEEGTTEAIRPFNLSPNTNDRISIKMDNSAVQPGGRVGLEIQNASNEKLLELSFVGGETEYRLDDASGSNLTGMSATSTGLLIEIELTSPTTFDLRLTDLVSGPPVTLSSRNLILPMSTDQTIHQIRLYNFQAGPRPTHDLFFNEISHELNALPIELASFEARTTSEAVELNWTTLSEENNEGFYIERSTNRTDFEQIHFEKGNGNTVEQVDYSFTDERPTDGVNYYRLKQIDFDGAYEYSDIVSVDFKGQATIKLFPNPSSDKLTISGNFSELVTLKIVDLNGKVLHQSEQFFAEQAEIGLDAIPSGSYILQIISTNNQSTLSTMSFVKR
jgi:hypothetical protein